MSRLFINFACIYIIFNSFVLGQSDSISSKIRVYAPTGNSKHKRTSSEKGYLWVVKLDVLSTIFAGNIPLFLEYRIAKNISLEAGLGLTYGSDIITNIINELEAGFFGYPSSRALGSSFKGAIKYYPSKDDNAIEGWNFGISFQHKNVRRKYDPNYNFEQDKLNTKNSFNLLISHQNFSISNICFEWSLGVGVSKNKLKSYIENSTGMPEVEIRNSIGPSFALGFKIGFGN
ncbi:MAG: hypothetical protein ABI851_12445 [Saprospiraceae bacterium]